MPKIEALTVSDAARRLALTTRTVNRWARAGKLDYLAKRPGRTGPYLFAESTIVQAARDAGVVSVLELARQVHPGDPEGHGVATIGVHLFGCEVEPDTGVVALLAAMVRAVNATHPCTNPECVAAAAEAEADV